MDYSLIYNINGEINNFTNEIKTELPPKKKKWFIISEHLKLHNA